VLIKRPKEHSKLLTERSECLKKRFQDCSSNGSGTSGRGGANRRTCADMGEGGQKSRKKMRTSFVNGLKAEVHLFTNAVSKRTLQVTGGTLCQVPIGAYEV